MRGSVAQKVFKMAYQMLFQKVHILTFFFFSILNNILYQTILNLEKGDDIPNIINFPNQETFDSKRGATINYAWAAVRNCDSPMQTWASGHPNKR